ncbi:MAG: hypothetical protein QG608_918 [Actinomycetota bacterium]|nr:hypothetical protein [Actinomycetota bacterium]
MRVREDVVVLPDGSYGLYGVVEKPDFSLVMPRYDGGFWMVEQFRYPIGRRSWEFPQGSWPVGRAGTSEELARAELAEETGLRAAHWKHLGRAYAACGFCAQGFDVHLAWDLTCGEPNREPTEQDMRHLPIDDADLDRMILAGEIVDAHTLAALTLHRITTG